MKSTENSSSMEFDDEFDLDTLADLLDEDDFGTEACVTGNSETTGFGLSDDAKNTNSISGKTENQNINSVPTTCPSLTFHDSKASTASEGSVSAAVNHQNLTDTKNGQENSYRHSKNNPRILKDIPIDIFETESNIPDVCEKRKGRSLAEDIAETALSKRINSVVHSGDTDSSDEEFKADLTEIGRTIEKKIAPKSNYNTVKPKAFKTWKSELKQSGIEKHFEVSKGQQESFVADRFTGIRIVNPLVPLTLFESKMSGRRMIKMSFIRNFMKKGDIEGDWVTMGVLVSKLPPKTSKNGKTYSIWKMTDLIDTDKVVTVFLFGAVHAEHWKTTVGTVIGILNPSFMPDRDGYKSDGITLSVDHPGKFMMMGTSKDFGHCKASRKDGASCTSVVNKSQGEYCVYHITKEYKKLSSKRTDLQSSKLAANFREEEGYHCKLFCMEYPQRSGERRCRNPRFSGKEPNLKNKILKGSAVMYGGQLYSQPAPTRKSTPQANSKDKLRLNNLGLKRKAEAVELEVEEKAKHQKKLTELYNVECAAAAKFSSQSQFINQQLSIPTAGSRNLVKYFVKEEKLEESKKKEFKSITPKELLKMHEQMLKERRLKVQNANVEGSPVLKNISPQMERSPTLKNISSQVERSSTLKNMPSQMKRSPTLKNMLPQIGRGIQPGQDIDFDMSTPIRYQNYTSKDLAKLRAIESVKQKGRICPKDPNAVKSMKSPEMLNRIKMSLAKAEEAATPVTEKPENKMQAGILGSIDMNSERIKKMLNRKSSHAHEVEMAEVEKQESYFSRLEKKEQMEEKMASITEIVCKVVSCKVCQYTVEKVLDFCKDNDHPLRWHKAVKRFFECTTCKSHTFSFSKYPTKACSSCNSSTFVKSGMMKKRLAQKTAEELVLRGGDVESLNSVSTKRF